MHPGNVASHQRYDGALQDRYTAMDHCHRMRHDVNVSLLVLHVVLVAVWSHAAHVGLSALRHSSYLSIHRIALLGDVRAHPWKL